MRPGQRKVATPRDAGDAFEQEQPGGLGRAAMPDGAHDRQDPVGERIGTEDEDERCQ